MSSRPDLLIAHCDAAAARFACEKWHYSKSIPPAKRSGLFGVWERGQFVGAVVFGGGANLDLVKPFGLERSEGCELVRVALGVHATPVSRIVAIALRIVSREQPMLKAIVSFADPAEGHVGAIYQAGNWLYMGSSKPSVAYFDRHGKRWHKRVVSASGTARVFGRRKSVITPEHVVAIETPGKHRYVMPLDSETRARLAVRCKPYPKRVGGVAGGTPGPTGRRRFETEPDA